MYIALCIWLQLQLRHKMGQSVRRRARVCRQNSGLFCDSTERLSHMGDC